MCNPTVTSAAASAPRIAEVIRASHLPAESRLGGITQLEVSLPRSLAGRRRGEEGLGVRDERICVPVAESRPDDSAARDDAKASVPLRPAERPGWEPVDAAHVSGEQRRHD